MCCYTVNNNHFTSVANLVMAHGVSQMGQRGPNVSSILGICQSSSRSLFPINLQVTNGCLSERVRAKQSRVPSKHQPSFCRVVPTDNFSHHVSLPLKYSNLKLLFHFIFVFLSFVFHSFCISLKIFSLLTNGLHWSHFLCRLSKIINITAGIIVYAYLVLIYYIQIFIISLKIEINGIMNTYHHWFMYTCVR